MGAGENRDDRERAMTTRFCDGGSSAGVAVTGIACSCGLVFDDTKATIVYPHTPIASTAWYPGTAVSMTYNWPLYYPPPPPNAATFTDMDMSRFAAAYSTVVPKGGKVVICVDMDATQEQIDHLADCLRQNDIDALVIRGARAGTGYAESRPLADPAEKRLEILARIADCWQQRPDLSLSELLAWMPASPEKMTDEDFAAATEVHFRKVYGAVHGENS